MIIGPLIPEIQLSLKFENISSNLTLDCPDLHPGFLAQLPFFLILCQTMPEWLRDLSFVSLAINRLTCPFPVSLPRLHLLFHLGLLYSLILDKLFPAFASKMLPFLCLLVYLIISQFIWLGFLKWPNGISPQSLICWFSIFHRHCKVHPDLNKKQNLEFRVASPLFPHSFLTCSMHECPNKTTTVSIENHSSILVPTKCKQTPRYL